MSDPEALRDIVGAALGAALFGVALFLVVSARIAYENRKRRAAHVAQAIRDGKLIRTPQGVRLSPEYAGRIIDRNREGLDALAPFDGPVGGDPPAPEH